MARTTSAARRYAEAAYDIARRDDTVEAWLEQLERAAAVASDATVVRRLEDPAVPFEARREALQAAIGEGILAQVANLLELMLRRRRVELLARIGPEFRTLYNRQHGITAAIAVSATELDEAALATLREQVERIAGGRVELTHEIDPSLIGGIQLRLGDRLIDGSVRGRLERLRNELAARA